MFSMLKKIISYNIPEDSFILPERFCFQQLKINMPSKVFSHIVHSEFPLHYYGIKGYTTLRFQIEITDKTKCQV